MGPGCLKPVILGYREPRQLELSSGSPGPKSTLGLSGRKACTRRGMRPTLPLIKVTWCEAAGAAEFVFPRGENLRLGLESLRVF